jgi:hypothetical protein
MAVLKASTRAAFVIALVVCLCAGPTLHAQQPGAAMVANLKAVFLFNFAKYVTFPAAQMGERSPSDIRICVTAADSFFALLKTAIQGETVDGKPLEPVALTGLDDARTCQILYVGNSSSADARAWFGAVRNSQVLTVGDGSASDEPVIAFIRDQTRVRFDVNRVAAARHNVSISSKLLRLARAVKER